MHRRKGYAVWGCLTCWLIKPRFPRDKFGGNGVSASVGIQTVSDRGTRTFCQQETLIWRHLRLPQQRTDTLAEGRQPSNPARDSKCWHDKPWNLLHRLLGKLSLLKRRTISILDTLRITGAAQPTPDPPQYQSGRHHLSQSADRYGRPIPDGKMQSKSDGSTEIRA